MVGRSSNDRRVVIARAQGQVIWVRLFVGDPHRLVDLNHLAEPVGLPSYSAPSVQS